MLEIQLATGGVVDPKVGIRLPLELALRQNLLDKRMLLDFKERKAFIDPNTDESLSYSQLMDKSIVESSTGVQKGVKFC